MVYFHTIYRLGLPGDRVTAGSFSTICFNKCSGAPGGEACPRAPPPPRSPHLSPLLARRRLPPLLCRPPPLWSPPRPVLVPPVLPLCPTPA